ncbi:hypothetical protein B0H11DRAFT_2215645 [Mycena galericulata]|nr:hypothetical protein B0H11DRAFT_2215645 [Mycena galericulata]
MCARRPTPVRERAFPRAGIEQRGDDSRTEMDPLVDMDLSCAPMGSIAESLTGSWACAPPMIVERSAATWKQADCRAVLTREQDKDPDPTLAHIFDTTDQDVLLSEYINANIFSIMISPSVHPSLASLSPFLRFYNNIHFPV